MPEEEYFVNYTGGRFELFLLLVHYSNPLFSLVTSKTASLGCLKSLLNTMLAHPGTERIHLLPCRVTGNESSDSFFCVHVS